MPAKKPGLWSLLLLGWVLTLVLIGGLWALRGFDRLRPKGVENRGPAASRPAALAATPPANAAPRSYMELVRRTYPAFPTTRPLSDSLDLRFAGHFVLRGPVYLDSSRRLWITREDAEPIASVLGQVAGEEIVLTRERPVYVHWIANGAEYKPHLIGPNGRGDGYEVVDSGGRRPIGRGVDYDWARARYWDDRIVVPTSVGVSVFTLGREVVEAVSPPLAESGQAHAPVEITFCNGPLAWIPPGQDHPGSSGAVRFTNGAWTKLTPESGWPAGTVHLIPLLDGSVLQLLTGQGEALRLSIVPLDSMSAAEERRAVALILQLSDADAQKRQQAFDELTRYGPGLWPIAEKRMKLESPGTQARLRDLLRAKISPLLGGMSLVDGKMRVANRYPDGGVLFHVPRGVSMPQEGQPPLVVAPAWLTALAGDSIRLLNADLVRDMDPAKVQLVPWYPEWIVVDEVKGPMRFLGGELVPLLRKKERRYSEFVGIAAGGRYVFRKPQPQAAALRPATAPLAQEDAEEPVLIIDPRLPDPKPRLPVWSLYYPGGTVGWDKNDWPAAKQQSAFALGTSEWRVLDGNEPFYTRADQVPPVPAPPLMVAATPAATRPGTVPSTQLSSRIEPGEKPLLLDGEGNYYFDGRQSLTVLRRDGSVVVWALPPVAAGRDEAHLVRSKDGLLFLFNEPGRVLRIRTTPEGNEPFVLDAVFTQKIPNTTATRIWMDPFDRIVIAYEDKRLAILFPQGFIPTAIANLMPASELEDSIDK
jgi:hypothetical protein